MADDPEIERLKVALERDKLDFEKQKFAADEAKRSEELAKLKADREKTELDSADLRIPYQQRASYKTAIYQGRASIVAVAVLLVSALSLKPLYDAFEAKQAQAIAVAGEKSAQEQMDQADRQRNAANEALKKLQQERHDLDQQVAGARTQLLQLEAQGARAKEEALRGLVDGVTSSLGAHPKPEQRKLLENLLSGDGVNVGSHRTYLRSIAFSEPRPLMLRFYILAALYDSSRRDNSPESLREQEQLKRELIGLTDKPQQILPGEYHDFWSSLDSFFGASQMHFYACQAYSGLAPAPPSNYAGPHTLNETAAQYILFTYSAFPECYQASLDALEPAHAAVLFLPAFPGPPPAFSEAMVFLAISPQFQLLPAAGVYAANSLNNVVEAPQYILDIRKPKYTLTFTQNNEMIQLRSRFPLFSVVFSEPGLKRLRSCSPSLLAPLKKNLWLEEQQLKSYCPVETW